MVEVLKILLGTKLLIILLINTSYVILITQMRIHNGTLA